MRFAFCPGWKSAKEGATATLERRSSRSEARGRTRVSCAGHGACAAPGRASSWWPTGTNTIKRFFPWTDEDLLIATRFWCVIWCTNWAGTRILFPRLTVTLAKILKIYKKTITLGGKITVWLTSCFTGLDLTKQVKLLLIQHKKASESK